MNYVCTVTESVCVTWFYVLVCVCALVFMCTHLMLCQRKIGFAQAALTSVLLWLLLT